MKTKMLYGLLGMFTFFSAMFGSRVSNGESCIMKRNHAVNCEFDGNTSEYYDWRGLFYNYYTSGPVKTYFCPIESEYVQEGGTDVPAAIEAIFLDGVQIFVYDGNTDTGTGYDVSSALCYVNWSTSAFEVSCGTAANTSSVGQYVLSPGLPSSYAYMNSLMFIEGYYPYKDIWSPIPSEPISIIHGYFAYDTCFD